MVPGHNRIKKLLCLSRRAHGDLAGRSGCVIHSAISPGTNCSGSAPVTNETKESETPDRQPIGYQM